MRRGQAPWENEVTTAQQPAGVAAASPSHDLVAAGGLVIAQRERQLALAGLRKAVEHALRARVSRSAGGCALDRGPRGDIVESAAASAGENSSLTLVKSSAKRASVEPSWGRVSMSAVQERQQGLADDAPFVAHAAQQQLLAFLVGIAEAIIDDERDEQKDHREQHRLGGQRPDAQRSAARRRPSLVAVQR